MRSLGLLLLPIVLAAEREWDFGTYVATTENNYLKSVWCKDEDLSEWNLANLDLKSFDGKSFRNESCIFLRNLNLDNNWLSIIPDLAFANLPGLNRLSIADNEISDIGSQAFVNTNLNYIDISNNRLTQLGRHQFFGMRDQVFIDIRGNNLRSISSLLFKSPMEFLSDDQTKTADSQMENLSTVPTVLPTNDSTSVEVCIEDRILISVEYVQKGAHLEPQCHEVQIKNAELDLSRHKLHGISNGAFSRVNNLVKLNLSNNELGVLTNGSLHGLSSLQFLDLSHCQLQRIERGAFEDLTALRDLDLSTNFISLYKGIYAGLENIEVLNIADNGLTEITSNTLYAMPDSLATVILDSNNIKKLVKGSFRRVPKHTLSLERNQITDIEPGSFLLPNLKRLSLAWNNIQIESSRFVGRDVQLFRDLNSLELLDLTNNTIETLYRGNLYGLPTSRECIIIVSGTSIGYINGGLFDN